MIERTFGFKVSVDESHEMKVFQSRGDFGSIEASGIFVDALIGSSLQSAEELSSAAVFHA
jgi:hypothetical protein